MEIRMLHWGFFFYLWPEKPTLLGFLIMVSIYFLKRVGFGGPKVDLRVAEEYKGCPF